MLRKIEISQVRIGMYCSSWVELNSKPEKDFLIADEQILDQIIKSTNQNIFIDTNRGVDVNGIKPQPLAKKTISTPLNEVRINHRPTTFNVELKEASQIVDRSRVLIDSLFNEARMGKAINIDDTAPIVKEITASVMRNPHALISLARLKTKDNYTYMHWIAVSALMVSLAKELELPEQQIRDAGLAGLLHDIGKMTIPSEILNNPGKLTAAEFEQVKNHPKAGYEILLECPGICAVALDVCLHHHEKMDGTGYPQGLSGDDISLFARMGAICDVYDAITSNRSYNQGWCPSESLRQMASLKGHFDPVIFYAFVKSMGIYPVGTLVRLKSGGMGVVMQQAVGKSLLLPKVKVFYNSLSHSYFTPQVIDLADDHLSDSIVTRENASKWRLVDIDQYWLGKPTA